MVNLIGHEILSRRGAIIGWSIGLILFGLMYTTIYPEMEDQMTGLADLSIYQAMGVEVATFEGYLGSTVIGFIPILLGVYAVLAGTATLAGEEESGTLELLLTTRLRRWQIVTAKAAALLVVTGIIVIYAALGNVLGFNIVASQIETSIGSTAVFLVVLASLPLVWALLMISLFLSALMPSRRLAMLIGFLILTTAYFGENIGGMVSSLEPIRPLSLFTYFDSSSAVFRDGIDPSNLAILLIISAVAFLLAVISFQIRDVTVGNWPWQRRRSGASA